MRFQLWASQKKEMIKMNASRRRCEGVALENAACVFETKLRPLTICGQVCESGPIIYFRIEVCASEHFLQTSNHPRVW